MYRGERELWTVRIDQFLTTRYNRTREVSIMLLAGERVGRYYNVWSELGH